MWEFQFSFPNVKFWILFYFSHMSRSLAISPYGLIFIYLIINKFELFILSLLTI